MSTRLVKRRKPIHREQIMQALHNLQAKGLIEQRPDGRWYAISGSEVIKRLIVVPEIPPRLTDDSAQRLRVGIMMAMAQLADRMTDMALWRETVFAFLQRNAERSAAFFGVPPRQVVEFGTEIEI